MKNNCAQTQELISALFDGTNANEVSETLSVILDSYIMNSPDDRLHLANAANLVRRLSAFAFNVERLYNERKDIIAALTVETQNQCSHN